MTLQSMVKDLSAEALENIFNDSMKRNDEESARIISNEILYRKLYGRGE